MDFYYYDGPIQCRYIRNGENHYGIVFQTYIIDAATGEVYDIDEIFNDGRSLSFNDDEIIGEKIWNDLTTLIR